MTRKTDPTREQLLAMVPHIGYDLVQLVEVAKAVRPGLARTHVENALVDGTLVYARKLLVFLDPPPDRRDWREGDVYAVDYIDGWTIPQSWWDHTNRDVMKAISTRAAHICLDRLDKLSWNTNAIAGSITEAMLVFIRALDDDYRTAFERSVRVPA